MGIAVIENNNRFNIVCNNIKDRSSKSEICNSKDGKRFYKIKGSIFRWGINEFRSKY